MKLKIAGKNISQVEIQNVSLQGIWILVDDQEHFFSCKSYPWFKEARIAHIYNVQ